MMDRDGSVEAVAWPATLAGAAVLGSLAIACMMPFVGIALVAAATMRRGQAVVTVIGAWAANQLLGFGLLGYPPDGYAIGWGIALGIASLAAMLVAARVIGDGALRTGRVAAAFGMAFAVNQLGLFGFASVVGGTDTFTVGIVARLLMNDAAWAGGLLALGLGLAHIAPTLFGRRAARA
ncbi:hypothetical protein ASG29_10470 [Sphingomonas sp. Leaf412]|uniref:hypothetical protein n=1 Tax=Sphingomonas sp. Leaf412 TaxID=1736370 RepID=UPI0006F4E04A|nr:hypothetical protein [Sphingomonas sp. Leaf412]KQT32237.1 hypothetical protein ASG29_10470 [Sphingomonas sp. Leaf412]